MCDTERWAGITARLASKVMIQPSTGCWIWTGGTAGGKDKTRGWGYGRFWNDGQTRSAHIIMYEQVFGRLPLGTEIDHTCSNRRCVNPHHLEAVTHSVNQKRAYERRKKVNCTV